MPKTKRGRINSLSFLDQVHLGDSYTSLFLGIIAVFAATLLFVFFVNSKRVNTPSVTREVSSDRIVNETIENQTSGLPNTYTVLAGDDLWKIAEKFYKSGYNWVDIAKANNIPDPDIIAAGIKLTIPKTEPVLISQVVMQQAPQKMQEETQGKSITGDSYTVKTGDYLWDIAVRAYGDGYRWVDIAKTNSLENPDLIFSGNVLKLPR